MTQPTAPELAFLKSLWRKQPKSARQLHDEVGAGMNWSYSTTRKVLERMGEKRLVQAEASGNKKIYTAAVEKLPTLASIAKDFARRVFEMDDPIPAALFGSSQIMSDEEISELEKLLESADKESSDE